MCGRPIAVKAAGLCETHYKVSAKIINLEFIVSNVATIALLNDWCGIGHFNHPSSVLQEYLVRNINTHHLDPIDFLGLEDVMVVTQRESQLRGIDVPQKLDAESAVMYKTKIIEVRLGS